MKKLNIKKPKKSTVIYMTVLSALSVAAGVVSYKCMNANMPDISEMLAEGMKELDAVDSVNEAITESSENDN